MKKGKVYNLQFTIPYPPMEGVFTIFDMMLNIQFIIFDLF